MASSPRSDDADVPRYFPALDGLRLLCCAAVIIGHAYVGHPWNAFASKLSGMGVDVFFSLSGFLITTLLLRELSENGSVSLRAFYVRRALRIFPVYYAAVGLGMILIVVFRDRYCRPFATQYADIRLGDVAATHLTFLANWISTPVPTSLDVLWSVCVEEQFYLLFPITFFRSRGRHPALPSIAVGLAIAWSARAYLVQHAPGEIYRHTFAHGDHLLLGALLAQALHAYPRSVVRVVRRGGVVAEVAVLAAIGGLLAWEAHGELGGLALFVDYAISAVASTALVAIIGVGTGRLARVLTRPTPRFLGQLTYAGYVFHMYALVVAWFAVGRVTSTVTLAAPLRTLIAIPLTFVIAYAVRVAFEGRVLALKARFSRVATASAAPEPAVQLSKQ